MLANVTMIFPAMVPHRYTPILSPATWAITVELFFYALICLGISKTKNRVYIWLSISILYFIYTYYAKTATWRYGAIPAGSLPFAMGSLLFFFKDSIYGFLKRRKINSPVLWLSLFVLNPFVVNSFPGNTFILEASTYINLVAAFGLTCILFYQGFPFVGKKLDAALGEYSYPLYLLHYQAGAIVTFVLYSGSFNRGGVIDSKETSILAIPVLMVLSFISIHAIDRNINRVREKVKLSGKLVDQRQAT